MARCAQRVLSFTMHPSQIQERLTRLIESLLNEISVKTPDEKRSLLSGVVMDIPKDPKHGDLTTNAAMRFAKAFFMPSIELAKRIKDALSKRLESDAIGRFVSRLEVSPPGFINFRFSKEYLNLVLAEIRRKPESFGRSSNGNRKRVNIEFVSANPTGPLTIAHGRQGAVGNALARILDFSGYKVIKEYFINDVGTQISLLGRSIYVHYATFLGRNPQFPDDGYRGAYIKDIAEKLKNKYGGRFIDGSEKDIAFISKYGADTILKNIRSDLRKFGISFDKWFSQASLSESKIKVVLSDLKAKGYVFEKDGATWFKSTAFGDGKDRVVIKSDGSFTYLAPDIAYHLNKIKRGFDRLIDIWGPDHHGYIPRLKASVEALGYDRKKISVLIVQLATLFRAGETLSMSTRKGEFITLSEVIDEVGGDVTKFFFLMRNLDSHLDFDLETAKKSSMDNPVYYIQYAHARIASIFGFSEKLKGELSKVRYNPDLHSGPGELSLMRKLSEFPLAVEAAARTLEPYRIVQYLNDLAKEFHSFYAKHRVVADDNLELTKARLALVLGVKAILATGLNLLGISFPERM